MGWRNEAWGEIARRREALQPISPSAVHIDCKGEVRSSCSPRPAPDRCCCRRSRQRRCRLTTLPLPSSPAQAVRAAGRRAVLVSALAVGDKVRSAAVVLHGSNLLALAGAAQTDAA